MGQLLLDGENEALVEWHRSTSKLGVKTRVINGTTLFYRRLLEVQHANHHNVYWLIIAWPQLPFLEIIRVAVQRG